MLPFLGERSPEYWFARTTVPVLRICLVALMTVKVRVNPGAVAVVSGLCCLMRSGPITLRGKLQGALWAVQLWPWGDLKWMRHMFWMHEPRSWAGDRGTFALAPYYGSMPEPLVTVHELTKEYRTPGLPPVSLFHNLNFTVDRGEMLAIVGESGTGKSTLLHLLAGLDTPTGGTVQVADTLVSSLDADNLASFRNREIGYVWQAHYLLPEFTALENVAIPLLARGVTAATARQSALHRLGEVGLEQRAEHRAGELSGGEQQRVSLARALVGSPRLLLADEPTGNLDVRTGELIFALLQRVHRNFGMTTVLVTHNEGFARRCDRALRLGGGGLADGVPGMLLFPPKSVQ